MTEPNKYTFDFSMFMPKPGEDPAPADVQAVEPVEPVKEKRTSGKVKGGVKMVETTSLRWEPRLRR